MKTEDFNYNLPPELIAQEPAKERTLSRLMIVKRECQSTENKMFTDILEYLQKGDVLVFNDSKVLKARIIGEKEDTKAKIEILLLKSESEDTWEVLAKPARRVKTGTIIKFSDKLTGLCLSEAEEGIRKIKFTFSGDFEAILEEIGTMPLPPYITGRDFEESRYQTVYAKNAGSVAAPTAGLHFTPEILEQIRQKGVETVFLTLHVGLGTFKPVEAEDIKDHKMHEEMYTVSEEAALALNKAKTEGRRIIAIGTTSIRTLESNYRNGFIAETSPTGIFIYPGYQFKTIDGLLTNFHLPKSTLMMLISALAGKELIFKAYEEAIKERYRFFSFGDAMLIL
ncbi:MAG: tRNA preQ1(34) S-adenosylmethionine ribosyltransferase-isomerase QueA [Erysipelotrichales bacterium]|nr:tRNA preQ1(34) S-adenosylmethionine ribosyltransferase-isomerase QueA [Erysipelotrichales bacterium]